MMITKNTKTLPSWFRQEIPDMFKIQTDSSDKRYQIDANARLQLVLAGKKGDDQLVIEQTKAAIKNAPVELGNEAIRQTGQNVEILAGQMAESLSQFNLALQEIKASNDAPIKLVRENGKIVGKQGSNGQVIRIEDSA